MGMAASSLRFAQLTARKNQVEFEGQQINQQRLTLSQKSSAIYNDMLTKQVPTAPDPSQFTKIVYKFNRGKGTEEILNLARKASGAYNYNITYKKPATSKVLSRSSYSNVNFAKTIGGTSGAYTANINGVSRELKLVGDDDKKEKYEKALTIYNQLKAIDETRAAINANNSSINTKSLQEYGQSAGLSNLFVKTNDGYEVKNGKDPLTIALFKAAGLDSAGEDDWANAPIDPEDLTGDVATLISVLTGNALNKDLSNDEADTIFQSIAEKLCNIKLDDADSPTMTNYTSAEYKDEVLDSAFIAYQANCATAGIVNIGEGQALYSYKDDNGDTCYMYVPIENVMNDINSSYAEQVTVYEQLESYLEDQTETDQMDANVILSDDGQISKITFADGTVVTPEVVTEMDQDAYDQAMVEYEYKKDVYDKEMNDANARVKIIQAQDQKLEVRLKQLDTEQKALSTEIDAVKSVRDKSIEGSFKTFG